MNDIKEAWLAQRRLCDDLMIGYFVPDDGDCPKCGANIYDDGGYDVEYASRWPIEKCPFCGASFLFPEDEVGGEWPDE